MARFGKTPAPKKAPAKPAAENPAPAPAPAPAPTPKQGRDRVAVATGQLEGIAADLKATIGTLGSDEERGALVARITEVLATLKGDV